MPESHWRDGRGTACIGWVQHENRVWEFINQFHKLSLGKESGEPTQQPTKYKNRNHMAFVLFLPDSCSITVLDTYPGKHILDYIICKYSE